MNFTLDLNEKIKLAEWMAKMNNGCVTGSIMLNKRGISLDRDADDIDIVVSNSQKFDNLVIPPIFTKQYNIPNGNDNIIMALEYLGTNIKIFKDDRTLELSTAIEGSECRYATLDRLSEIKLGYLRQDIPIEYKNKTIRDLIKIREKFGNENVYKKHLTKKLYDTLEDSFLESFF